MLGCHHSSSDSFIGGKLLLVRVVFLFHAHILYIF